MDRKRAQLINSRLDESPVEPDHQASIKNTSDAAYNNNKDVKAKCNNQVAQLVRLFEHSSDLSKSTNHSNAVMGRGSTHNTITFSGNDEDVRSEATPSKNASKESPHDGLLQVKLSANMGYEQNIDSLVNVALHDGPGRGEASIPADDGGGDCDNERDSEGKNQCALKLLRNSPRSKVLDEVAYVDNDFYKSYSIEQRRSEQQTSRHESDYEQDQLPLIEEYKAIKMHKDSFGFIPRLSKRLSRRPDPPAFSQVDIGDGFELSNIPRVYDHYEIRRENQLYQAEEAGLVNSDFKPHITTISGDDMDALCSHAWIDTRLSRRRRMHRMFASCCAITLCGGIVLFLTITGLRELITRSGVSQTSLSSRLDDVTYFLAVNNYSQLELLQQSGTPQNRAATWIADVDPQHLSLKGNNHVEFLHRYSLAVLYFALGGDDKSGSSWRDNIQFLSAGHICTWVMNVPNDSGKSVSKGVQCQERDHHEIPVKLSLRKFAKS